MPVASARSFLGNHSATVLMEAGKLPASPSPSRNRMRAKPGGGAGEEHDREPGRGVEVDGGQLQPGHPVGHGVAHGGHAPDDDRDGEAAPRAELVHHPAGQQQPDRVGELEGEDDGGVDALVLPAELLHEGRLQDADDLAVDVVDGGGEEQQRADHPAVVAGAAVTAAGAAASAACAHWFTPLARNPPSTASTSPFTKLAASEARNTAAPASSSARPKRLQGRARQELLAARACPPGACG